MDSSRLAELNARYDLIAPSNYCPVGPDLPGGKHKLTPRMTASLSDAQLNRWHYAERHAARNLAREIVAMEAA